MTVSELQRKLLYRGHDDMADYLRNSPFNRSVFNVLLNYGPKPLPVPMLVIFNEAYYQCLRVNFDPNPGTDLANRYLQEETLWLASCEAAKLVFSLVWVLLRCKDAKTFNEECFVDQFYPLLGKEINKKFAYILFNCTVGDRKLLPKHFKPMPTPVDELPLICSKTDCVVWRIVMDNFSQKTIERYLDLYETPEEQTNLLSMIEGAYAEMGNKSCRVNFTKLHQGIVANVYHQVSEQEAEYAEGMDLTYKEQLQELQKKYESLERTHEYRIREIEIRHQNELEELREKLEQKILSGKQNDDPKVLLFTFTEMVELVRSRFSKAGAEEFTNMLYNLAIKHGYLDEEISKAIDGIVPAVQQREKGNTTVQIPEAQQVNINPQNVNNNLGKPL